MRVAIYGQADTGVIKTFKQRLTQQGRRLGIAVTFGSAAAKRDESRIAVIFASAGSTWSPGDERSFRALLARGVVMLSVVPDAPAARFLPSAVSHLNAFIMNMFGDAWAECLADEIISMMWLHRRTPRVFISYKRTDSGPIASQLYERFSRLGYDVFFDEASVQRGADFQRELMWWLNDADLLVVLCSPNFPSSNWCMQEVTFCQKRYIGLAVIEWPTEVYEGRIAFPGVNRATRKPVILKAPGPDQLLTLQPRDFAGMPAKRGRRKDLKLETRELTSVALSRVVAWCARQRTVGIRQRLDNLVPLARRVLPGATAAAGARGPGDLIFQDATGTSAFVRVIPFRPRAETIWQACADGVKHGVSGCFYEENDPNDPRALALRWLANGKRPLDPSRSDGRIWACIGDQLL